MGNSAEAWTGFWTVFGVLGGIGIGAGAVAALIYLGGFAAAGLGWSDLARVYPAGERPPEGLIVRGCGGSIGMTRYRGSLVAGRWETVGGSHPPILLPWSGVKRATREERGTGRHGVIEFRDDDHWTMTLIVPNPRREDPYSATGWSNFPE